MPQKRTHKLNLGIKFLAFFALVSFAVTLFAYASPGKSTGYVNDFAGVLSNETKTSLESELGAYKKSTSNEISVVTIKSLGGDTIENYANNLFREWGIGDKTKNNGALLLIATDEHKLRIEVGYGLEGALPDLATYNIEQTVIVPRLKEGNFDMAVLDGTHAILGTLNGQIPIPQEQTPNTNSIWKLAHYIPFLIFFVIQILFGILAPSKSWWLGGVLGGVVGGVIGLVAKSIIWGAIGAVSLAGLGLVFDYLVSRAYQARGKGRQDFWTGGGFWGGGFGGGSGGFGGFGGGSSGGGGSSSSW